MCAIGSGSEKSHHPETDSACKLWCSTIFYTLPHKILEQPLGACHPFSILERKTVWHSLNLIFLIDISELSLDMWFGHAFRNQCFSFGLGLITPLQHFSRWRSSLPPLLSSGVFERITWNYWCLQVSVWSVKPCLRSKSMSHSHGVRTESIHLSKRHKGKEQHPLDFPTHRAVAFRRCSFKAQWFMTYGGNWTKSLNSQGI